MTQSKISSARNIPDDNQADRVFRYILVTAGLMALAAIAILLLFGLPTSLYDATYWAAFVAIVALFSAWVTKQGRVDLGLALVIGAIQIGIIIPPIESSGLGIALAAVGLTSTFSLTPFMRSQRLIRVANGLSIAVAMLLLGLDIFEPFQRIPNTNLTATWIVAGCVALSYIIVILRHFPSYSLRNKLLFGFISVTVIATGTLALFSYISTSNILQTGLENELKQHTDGVVTKIGTLFDNQINTLSTLAINEVLQQAVEKSNTAYEGNATDIQAALETKDAQWRAADAANNNADPLVQEHLSNEVARDLLEYQATFPNNVEIFVTDIYGGLAGATNRTSDYYQADEDWWKAAYNNGQGAIHISDPDFDESSGALGINIALPLRSRNTGETIGILRTTVILSAITSILEEKVGQTGETDLFIPGQFTYHIHEGQYTPVEPEEFARLQSLTNLGLVETNYEGTASVIIQEPIRSAGGNPVVDSLGWVVVFHQNRVEAFAPATTQVRQIILVMIVVVAVAAAAAFGASLWLVRPITQLTKTAEQVSAGNLNSRAEVTSTDEVGSLATAFNTMTSQLQEVLAGLEQRVAARTKDLAVVAEVSTATATILETDKLLQEVVNLSKERFNLYHSHIYLLDQTGENLVLASGAGEAGRQMKAQGLSIPLSREQSLVARAARERKGVTVNDVTLAPDFLPNPLLPDTRSELAVPMIAGGQLVGVFDIQSDEVGRFTGSDINIQTALAAQVAISIQNVRSFEQSKTQADLESMVNAIGQKIQRAGTVEYTLQTAVREIGMALGASRVSIKIQTARQTDSVEADEVLSGVQDDQVIL